MPVTRRDVLDGLIGGIATGGLLGLAGCSSSCPDSDRPTPEETVAILDDPASPFSSTPAGRWTGPHGAAGNTGYAPVTLPDGNLAVRWRTALDLPSTDEGALSASAPSVGAGRVVVTDERRAHALSLRTGEIEWTSPAVSPTTHDTVDEYRANTAAPAIGPDGHVYVGTSDGVIALDGTDGSVRWQITGYKDVGTPAVHDGSVYGFGATELLAADPTGEERWRRSIRRGGAPTSPAVGGDRVVVPGERSLVAVHRESGERAWERDFYASSPVSLSEYCLAGTDDALRALSAESGDEEWSFSRGEHRAMGSPVATPETIYAVERPPEAGAATFAIERDSGDPNPRWCSYVGSGAVTGATDSLALAVVAPSSGPDAVQSIAAFTADLGTVPWAIAGGSRPRSWVTPPAIVDGAVVVTTRGGTTAAIGGVP